MGAGGSSRTRQRSAFFCFPLKEEFGIQDTTKRVRVNRQIRISPVRVIGADGSQLGILEVDAALRMEDDQGLDLGIGAFDKISARPGRRLACLLYAICRCSAPLPRQRISAHAHVLKTPRLLRAGMCRSCRSPRFSACSTRSR